MCAQNINSSNPGDVQNNRSAEEMPEKTPFYYSTGWLILWSFLIWPIGLLMMLGYLSNLKKHELPRTNIIKKDLNDL
ncbi:MAG: hypothetical protein ACOH15_08050 [Acetobacterium sp.]